MLSTCTHAIQKPLLSDTANCNICHHTGLCDGDIARKTSPLTAHRSSRYEKEFEQVQDVFELQRNLNNAFAYDLVPSPSVVTAALRAARRVNDFPTAVRIFEGTFQQNKHRHTGVRTSTDVESSNAPYGSVVLSPLQISCHARVLQLLFPPLKSICPHFPLY